jgi:hypothetical protein
MYEGRRNHYSYFSLLSEQDVHQVRKQKRMGREFKMTVELKSYEKDNVMLDLGSNVKILPKKSWELMGKPNLVWSPIQLSWLTNT